MTERWLRKLEVIERVGPPLDLLERAEVGPQRPEPGPSWSARAAAVLLSVALVAAGSWGAIAALRGSRSGDAAGETETFSAVWPESRFEEAWLVQQRVDEGDSALEWRTDPVAVGLRYAEKVLGWPGPTATTLEQADGAVAVFLRGPIASCEDECDDPPPAVVATSVVVQQLVRAGEGGIWSVTSLGPLAEPITGSRPRIGGWPEDVDGDGQISDTGDERIPTLIRSVGDAGIAGYVRYADLEGPEPSNPEEAVAMSGQTSVVPIYADDGMTVIDWLTISSGERPTEPPSEGE